MNIDQNPNNTGIDVIIDLLTPCLVNPETGEEFKTTFTEISLIEIKKLDLRKWAFNWMLPSFEGYITYGLTIAGESELQGMIAIKPDFNNSAIDINIIESAPHNRGDNRRFLGVGAHLFAIASKISFDLGFDGWVFFEAKTELTEHYHQEVGATQIGNSQRMFLDTKASKVLVQRYFDKEGK